MSKMDKTAKQLTKSLKIRVLKCIRKADRAKSPRVKIDKADEAIKYLRQALKLIEDSILEKYIELCETFKLKVQIDALQDQANQYLAQIEEDKEHSEILFKKALSRLQAILDIEPCNDRVRVEINRLEERFQAKFGQKTEKPLLNFKEDWNLRIKFKLKEFKELLENWDGYCQYELKEDPVEPYVYTIDFKIQDFLIFREIYEELKMVTPLQIYLDDKLLNEEVFASWIQCYSNYLKAKDSYYCYGATPFSYNFIGCQKAQLRDIESRWENCWFRYGEMDASLGIFFVDKEQLFLRIQANLLPYTFCPALNPQKLELGLQLVPNSINPQKDKDWDYILAKGEKVGVIPKGKEIFITLNHYTFGTPKPVETGATSQLRKCLNILQNGISEEEVHGSKNVKISSCRYCESSYERGSTFCRECGKSFWQEIFGTHQRFLPNLLRRFRRRRVETLHAPLVFPQDTEEYEKADSEEEVSAPPLFEEEEVYLIPEILETSETLPDKVSQEENKIQEAMLEAENLIDLETDAFMNTAQLERIPDTTPEEIIPASKEVEKVGVGVNTAITEFIQPVEETRETDKKSENDECREETSDPKNMEGVPQVTQINAHNVLESIDVLLEGWNLENKDPSNLETLERIQESTQTCEDDEIVFAVPDFDFRPQTPSSDSDEVVLLETETSTEIEISEIKSGTEPVLIEKEDQPAEGLSEIPGSLEFPGKSTPDLTLSGTESVLNQQKINQDGSSDEESPPELLEEAFKEQIEEPSEVNFSAEEEAPEVSVSRKPFEFVVLDSDTEFSEEKVGPNSKEGLESSVQERPSVLKEIIPQILEEDLKEELTPLVLDSIEPNGFKQKEEPLSTVAHDNLSPKNSEEEKSYSASEQSGFTDRMKSLFLRNYRERKKIEKAFKAATPEIELGHNGNGNTLLRDPIETSLTGFSPEPQKDVKERKVEAELVRKVKAIRPKSDLSKRGVVRIVYSAILDRDTCPLCRFLHGMVFHPDQPEADIFKPPLHKGCKCMRIYVLNSEKPKNWPEVNFRPPPDELLKHLDSLKLRQYLADKSFVEG